MKAKALAYLGLVFLIGGCCKRNSDEAPPAPIEASDVGRFQLFYAPFPKEFDTAMWTTNGGLSSQYHRLFYIDTKTGKVWVYIPESRSTSTSDALLVTEGFIPISVVDKFSDLSQYISKNSQTTPTKPPIP